LLLSACGSSSNGTPNEKEVTFKKLLAPKEGNIYFAAFTNFTSTEDKVTEQKIEKFDTLAGKPVAWSYFSNNWTSDDSEGNHTPEIRYPYYNIHQVVEAGKTPFIRLMPWTSPHTVKAPTEKARKASGLNITSICKESETLSHNETQLIATSELNQFLQNGSTEGPCFNDFSMQNIIDGDWDNGLKEWARASKNDRDDDGDIIPLLVTFTVEMEGSWFPWSGIFNGGAITDQYGDPGLADGPERFRDAYRHIIDLFKEEKANHITWFFSPDTVNPNITWMKFLTEDWNHPRNYYPGDDYIDWIGFTLYGATGHSYNGTPWAWTNFSNELSQKYQIIQDISSDKPIAILETGVMEGHSDGTKSEWLDDMFSTILNGDYLNIKALTYWNTNWNSETIEGAKVVNLNIDSSTESLITFKALINDPRFISELRFSPQ
jgi:hypothetical protein